jgi:hypothetical protein
VRHDFSITSGTLFGWHKLPLRLYLLATVLVCDEVKGKSMWLTVRLPGASTAPATSTRTRDQTGAEKQPRKGDSQPVSTGGVGFGALLPASAWVR